MKCALWGRHWGARARAQEMKLKKKIEIKKEGSKLRGRNESFKSCVTEWKGRRVKMRRSYFCFVLNDSPFPFSEKDNFRTGWAYGQTLLNKNSRCHCMAE
jgi:hypothetical protein